MRWPLIEMLARYRDVFPEDADVVDRICDLIHSRPNCFDRTCRPGHITAAAWILSADRERVLLTHHRKLGRWLQLGGHTDGQWNVAEAALREAREESGFTHLEFVPIDGMLLPFDLDVHTIPARYDAHSQLVEDAHEHHDIRFLLVAHARSEIQVSDESHDVRWFTPAELREITDEESVLRMMYKTMALLG